MKGFAQLTFVGQIRKEPEYNVLRSGAEVANFEIAFCEKAGEDNWVWTNMRVALFGKSVETLKKYFTEKMWVAVSGKLKQEYWERDGEKRSGYRLTAESFTLMGDGDSKGGGSEQSKSTSSSKGSASGGAKKETTTSQPKMEPSDFPDEDLPF